MNNVLIYGAYGYTGQLIVELAVRKGWKPWVAGRNHELISALAQQYQLPFHCFEHNDQAAWDEALRDKSLLLNCAGPFSKTIRNILPACLRNRVNYTDITGEIEVFEYVKSFDQQAREAGITLMPGTGFDVVPTDCLAKFLYERLPDATHLEIGFHSKSGPSRGTALSILNRFHQGAAKREAGVLHSFPTGSICKEITLNGQKHLAVAIAWGDVFTAFHTTGIPNITVYTTMSDKTRKQLQTAHKWTGLIKSRVFQKIGGWLIRRKVVGPSAEQRNNLRSHIWAMVRNASGDVVEAEMETPEAYYLTAQTALICVEKILSGDAPTGYQTPAGALGSELILAVNGTARKVSLPH